MKQISQNYKSGDVVIDNVNTPALKSGGVLVLTKYSAISIGTEGMKVKEGKLSLLGKAKARPDQVKKVIDSVKQQGLLATYQKVMNKLDSLTPLGYSLSGVVTAVGVGAEEFQVGQRVACGGVGYANHAEINFVPKNLVVAIPDGVPMEHAAFTTVGSVAMQGFRQAEMQLGETACVIGLGLLGQILVQILRAAGINVIGIDLKQERCAMAEQFGAVFACTPDATDLAMRVKSATGGIGIDCTFITAGGNTNRPVELACELARDRGRLVDIGKTRLDLDWNEYYMKELDVRFSRSYGPGRYDPSYEEGGIDYPVGYVRWTERRNMQSFLALLAQGRLNMEKIVTGVYPFSDAESVFQELADGKDIPIGVVFQHAEVVADYQPAWVKDTFKEKHDGTSEKLSLGVIGAGNYASSMLLPHLAKSSGISLSEVATATSLSGENAARKFGFDRTSTDYTSMLRNDTIAAVLIATRHGAHASMAAEALLAGKVTYVEKPLAISLQGLGLVQNAVKDSGNNRLMVGFNRRFSPLLEETSKIFQGSKLPLIMNYRVLAGQIGEGSWYLDTSTHGTRFVGEAGHFLDVFSFLTNARPVNVVARALRPANITQDDLENVVVTVQYDDGSIGTLSYLTQGATKVPKEFLEVSGGLKTVQVHNFKYLKIFEGTGSRKHASRTIDKGQKEEMTRFAEAAKGVTPMPISLTSLFDTTAVTLAAIESLRMGQTVELSHYCRTLTDCTPEASGV
jgi:predicted dehydrogenase/threonine dehydrogenase-like Zn-dependent dehydrogenase